MKKDMFYVFVEGGGIPKRDHNDLMSAVGEAIRIAETQYKKTYVVQCVDIFEKTVKIEQTPLPCKICGGMPVHKDHQNINVITCFPCACIAGITKEEAIKNWNKVMDEK